MGTLFLNPIIITPKGLKKSFARPDWSMKKRFVLPVRNDNYVQNSRICHATIVAPDEKTKQEISTSSEDGIGIVRFMRGKVFLITGATGFLGKVLIEKILRSVPDVDKIYLLIKGGSENEAIERLKNEIVSSKVFERLKETYGESYQAFMLSKLVPVAGNICESNLGIKPVLAEAIANDVDIIVNSAANTTFDERYDIALDVNTRGVCRLMSFAKNCKKLGLFMQVSTAYVNGERKGRVFEIPFQMGDSIARETARTENLSTTIPMLDVEAEMKLALDAKAAFDDNTPSFTKKMKQLGLERARFHGWQDTYVFTKAMGEMMITSMRGEVPIVILRPSVIESTYMEPFPGWIEGNRMMDPIILSYGKGQINSFLVDSNGILDVIPADMVVNAILAVMSKHGGTKKSELSVYHISSSVANPLMFCEIQKYIFEHFNSFPHVDSKGKAIRVGRLKLFNTMDEFKTYMWRDLLQQRTRHPSGTSNISSSKRIEAMCKKLMEKIKHFAELYEPYTFYKGRFDSSNTQQLSQDMSDEEKMNFGFDVQTIDWKHYMCNVHICGLRTHVMK